MKFFNLRDPFFNPLWRRVVVFVICIGWAIFEFLGGTPFWGVLFASLGLYCGWVFFIAFVPHANGDGGNVEKSTDE